MRLYLLRHAKSSWDDPDLADFDRPLAPRGRKAAARMAAYMTRVGVRPQLVLCSTARRARQTCEAFSAGIGAEIRFEDRLYGASAPALLARLHELPEGAERVLLVGHNPGLHDLAISLSGAGERDDLERVRDRFPTGALAALSFGTPWPALGPGGARLEWFVTPRGLPDAV